MLSRKRRTGDFSCRRLPTASMLRYDRFDCSGIGFQPVRNNPDRLKTYPTAIPTTEHAMNLLKRLAPLFCLALGLAPAAASAADAPKGYQAKVKVGAATRIDWIFAV